MMPGDLCDGDRRRYLRDPIGRYEARHEDPAIPVVTVLGIQLQKVLSGAAVVEIVFGINGLGALAVQSVFDQDYTMIQGVVLSPS